MLTLCLRKYHTTLQLQLAFWRQTWWEKNKCHPCSTSLWRSPAVVDDQLSPLYQSIVCGCGLLLCLCDAGCWKSLTVSSGYQEIDSRACFSSRKEKNTFTTAAARPCWSDDTMEGAVFPLQPWMDFKRHLQTSGSSFKPCGSGAETTEDALCRPARLHPELWHRHWSHKHPMDPVYTTISRTTPWASVLVFIILPYNIWFYWSEFSPPGSINSAVSE